MKIDTMNNFQKNNPVIDKDEVALESDTGIFKVGDGVTQYNSLYVEGRDLVGTYAGLVEVEAIAAKVRNTPIVEVEESKTLALSDAGTLQQVTAVATLTVPLFTAVPFSVGTEIDVLADTDADVTIAAGTEEEVSVTIKSASNYVKIGAQNGVATLKNLAEDEWLLYGSLKASL